MLGLLNPTKWTTGHALRREIDSLDPVADDEQITAQVSDALFADAFFAHSVYLVTFARQIAVPGIAKVLWRSGAGDIARRPRERNNDTIIFFTEFYRRGYRSDDGRAAILRMEEIHSRFLIDPVEKMYTMATVIFEPDRLAAKFGENPFSEVDRQARWNFWRGVSEIMGMELPAETRADFLDWMVEYETANYACTEQGMGCYEGLVEDWLRWSPSWLPKREQLARHTLSALLEPPLRAAMGVPDPPLAVKLQVALVAKSYLRSTPLRIFRRDRSLVNHFGCERSNPHDLSTVGHVPPSERRRRS